MTKKKHTKLVVPAHHSSIETLSVFAWNKIHETGDLSFLLLKKNVLTLKQLTALQKTWDVLYQEYITVFGFGDNYKGILQERMSIGKLKLKKIISGDESVDNLMRHHKKRLDALESRNNKTGKDIYTTKQIIEKHFGIRIILQETSVREFYSYLRDINNQKK